MIFTIPLGLFLMGSLVSTLSESPRWKCPELNDTAASCICDFPRTLRCFSNLMVIQGILTKLKNLPPDTISLLDFTVPNITHLPGHLLEGVSLHGLVLTSGELRNISKDAFVGLTAPLQALGLPNNKLDKVPVDALGALSSLERLDLSYNRISSLNSGSLNDMENLTFLDVSNNKIENLAPDTFINMKNLSVLKLNRNKLTISNVSALIGLDGLKELDLSGNNLIGPIESTTIPSMPSLGTLVLANNKFSSISHGAMKGTSGLKSLTLSNNQIDVLEDHSFIELKNLRGLYLSNNRIVAISGSSLAHLTHLNELDLSHNFLRALTADITAPLTNLQILRLDDNDISLVESDTFRRNTSLVRLTISDNPLSCDCNLADFSAWLGNATKLSLADRRTAVCMTPPHLENALLMEVPMSDLRCEEDDYDLLMQEGPSATHISGSQIVLRAFNFNGTSISLLWSIETKAKSFSCDALFVYEETSTHEVLLTSTPLKCNSSEMTDPTTLVVKLGLGTMQFFHRYRFCVVLVEDDKYTDEVQLVLGCSEIIPLIASNHTVPQSPGSNIPPRITSVRANSSADTLNVVVDLWTQKKLVSSSTCQVTVSVFSKSTLLAQHLLNCTNPKVSIAGLTADTYQVCASLNQLGSPADRLQCTMVKYQTKADTTVWLTVCFILVTSFLFLVLYFVYKKLVKRSKLKTTHQCFLASNEFNDHQHKQHSRYVKLQTAYNL